MSLINPRITRVAAGLAVLSALAVSPMAAQAAVTDVTGTLTGGALSNTAPAITAFTTTLTGVSQGVTTAVGAWSVTDATGSDDGYSVTVSATAPAVTGGSAGTGGSISLAPRAAVAAAGNPALTGPVTTSGVPQLLPITGVGVVTVQNAVAGTGQGKWDIAADVALEKSLGVVIPGDASAGAYSSTLTYTTAAAVV